MIDQRARLTSPDAISGTASAPSFESTLPLSVTTVDDPARLPALAEAWDALQDERHPGAVFRSSAWLVPWWCHFGEGKQLRLYVASRGQELVGVLPAYRRRTALGGWQLRLLGDGVVTSDYLGVVADPDDQVAASNGIAQALLAQEEEIVFDGVEAGDPLVAALTVAAQAAGAAWAVSALGPGPFLTLGSADSYERWLREHPRANPGRRRKRRPLERRPGFRIERLASEDDIAEGLTLLWRLHRMRWDEEGGSAALDSPRVERFHQEAGRALARRGWASVHVMHVEGEPRAARYLFERGGRLADYQSGRDPAWLKRSVGSVLLDAVIEDAFTRDLVEVDFLRGDEPFKHLYTAEKRTIVAVRVASGPRARASFAVSQGWDRSREIARRVLSPDMRARLRRGETEIRRWLAARRVAS
jgi:CelD/BcsL family acetyltransferase involved in cellulose biosynthesis